MGRDCPGNVHYVAPEIIRPRRGAELKKSDLWAVGVITYYLTCGYFPFRGKKRKEVLAKIRESMTTSLRYPPTVSLSDDCKDFIESCMEFDIRKRMTAAEALRHPWIGDETFVSEPIPTIPSIAEDETEFDDVDDMDMSHSPGSPISLLTPHANYGNITGDPDPETLDTMSNLHVPKSSPNFMNASGSMDFSHLEDLDGDLIDSLLDEVDEDQKDAPIYIENIENIGNLENVHAEHVHVDHVHFHVEQVNVVNVVHIHESNYNRKSSHSARKMSYGYSLSHSRKSSVLDFEVEKVNGEMIDSILDGVEEKEDSMRVLQKATSVADDAVDAFTGFFTGISRSMKELVDIDVEKAAEALSG